MINIDKIRQEIERRKKENMDDDLPMTIGRYYEDRDLLAFIDSLPEDPDKSLEEAAENIYKVTFGTRAEDFIAGAEWAMHYQEKKIADAYEKGKQEGIRVVRSLESSPGQCGY